MGGGLILFFLLLGVFAGMVQVAIWLVSLLFQSGRHTVNPNVRIVELSNRAAEGFSRGCLYTVIGLGLGLVVLFLILAVVKLAGG